MGNTQETENLPEDFQSSFRIQAHRMGYVKRKRAEDVTLEFNYPGTFHLKTWCSMLGDSNCRGAETKHDYGVLVVESEEAAYAAAAANQERDAV